MFLNIIKGDLEQKLLNARIDKIHQPSKEEVVITFRVTGANKKLLLNSNAASSRIHITNESYNNPPSPPMFCQLLRKHLGSGRLISIEQPELERALYLKFQTTNEFAEQTIITLAIEIMGRHSNIILINQDGRVIDSIKRVNNEMSAIRQILPGIEYVIPPKQEKLNLFETSTQEIIEKIKQYKNVELSKCLLNILQGISPLICREIEFFVTRGEDTTKENLTSEHFDRLIFYINSMRSNLENQKYKYTMVYDKGKKPFEFSFIEIYQYSTFMITKSYENIEILLDDYYSQKDKIERMRQRSGDLLKFIINRIERINKKISAQIEEIAICKNKDVFRIKGDILNSNLHLIKKGDEKIVLQNFYDENFAEIEIELDNRLTPSKNAQKYYNEYRKLTVSEKMLETLIKDGNQEVLYLESVYDTICRTTDDAELLEIRQELSSQGYIKGYKLKNKNQKPLPPIKYISSDGYTILCGRNNIQNDTLTLKLAKKSDLWFHTQSIPGAHILLLTNGKDKNDIPDRTFNQALTIAAYNSKARDSAQVAVDYTEIKNVKKPNGAKPGMVIFENYYTAFITPDEQLVKSLMA